MYKFIFEIGKRLRNPSLNKQYNFLKLSEKWSVQKLEEYQLQKLQELVQIANNNSPYYAKLFKEHHININEIKSFEDFKKLPITSKETLLKYNSEIHTNLKFKKIFTANTSGTSGETLKFKREEQADSFNRAAIFRGYSWYKIKAWECNGYFWGFNFSSVSIIKTRILDFFQNRFRVFGYKENDLNLFVKKLQKAKYLHGYSSMIYKVAQYINKNNLAKPIHLKLVKGTSEKILNNYQKEVQEAFGQKIISEYGATETGIIAFECPQGNMHINMEGVFVEEINNEIIVTNLQMQSFPIIRYKLGDYIKLSPLKKCNCGMEHLVLEEVTGRVGAVVYGFKNEYPSLYFYYIFKNLAKKSISLTYQIIQEVKGEIIVNVEQKLDSEMLDVLKKEFKVYFNSDLKITVNSAVEINSTSKKMKSFISKV